MFMLSLCRSSFLFIFVHFLYISIYAPAFLHSGMGRNLCLHMATNTTKYRLYPNCLCAFAHSRAFCVFTKCFAICLLKEKKTLLCMYTRCCLMKAETWLESVYALAHFPARIAQQECHQRPALTQGFDCLEYNGGGDAHLDMHLNVYSIEISAIQMPNIHACMLMQILSLHTFILDGMCINICISMHISSDILPQLINCVWLDWSEGQGDRVLAICLGNLDAFLLHSSTCPLLTVSHPFEKYRKISESRYTFCIQGGKCIPHFV